MNSKDHNHEIWRNCQNCGQETDVRKSPYCDSCGSKVKLFRFSVTFTLLTSAILAIHLLWWCTTQVKFNFYILAMFLFFFIFTIITSAQVNDSYRF